MNKALVVICMLGGLALLIFKMSFVGTLDVMNFQDVGKSVIDGEILTSSKAINENNLATKEKENSNKTLEWLPEDEETEVARKAFISFLKMRKQALLNGNGLNISALMLNEIKSGRMPVNASLKDGSPDYSPLVASILIDDFVEIETLREFIREGANISNANIWHYAASKSEPHVIEELIKHGLNPVLEIRGRNLTTRTLLKCNIEGVKKLQELGYEYNKNIFTPDPNKKEIGEEKAMVISDLIAHSSCPRLINDFLKHNGEKM